MNAPGQPSSAETLAADGAAFRWLLLAGIWLVYFCFGLVGASMAPILPQIRSDLQITNATMGAILGTWQFVYIGAAIPCGMLLDRLRPRWTLLLGALFIALSALMRGLAEGTFMMFFAVGLFGIGGPLISVGAPKLAAQWFSSGQRGMAVGIYTTAPALGAAAAFAMTSSILMPLMGGAWQNVMFLYAALALLAGLIWFALASHPIAHTPFSPTGGKRDLDGRGVLDLLAIPAVPLVLAMALGIFFINHGLNNWLPEILRTKGLSEAQAGYWASVTMIAGIAGSLVVPRFATPSRRLAVLGLIFIAVTMSGLLLLAPAGPGLIAPLVMIGVARTSAMAVAVLLLLELPGVRPENRGRATGIFFVAAEIGGMLGPFTMGILAERSGDFDLAIWSVAATGLLLVLLTAAIARLGRSSGQGNS